MSCSTPDLTLDEALADPVIGAVLKADHIDRHHFETLLRSTARRLDGERGSVVRPSLARGLLPLASRLAGRHCRSGAGDIAAW